MFVVFEGIDGSGKTTVSNRVADQLAARGLTVRHLRADGKFASAVSEAIRDFGRDARHLDLVPEAEFLLYVARDVQLIQQVLRPALSTTDVVLSDRFLYTAEVLGRTGRHLPASFVAPILGAAAGGVVPDLVVLIDVDPVLARARRKLSKLSALDRKPPSRKGLAGVGLQHRLRRGYLELAATDPGHWVVVDNESALDDTVARVTALIDEALRGGTPTALARFRAAADARTPAPAPAPAPDADTKEALARFLAFVDGRLDREPGVAAYLLGGLSGAGIDERRERLAESVPEAVLAALDGQTDDVSFALRERLVGRFPGAVARSLGGIPSADPRARALRAVLEPLAPVEVAASLSRLDDEVAWEARERLYDRCAAVVVASLGGLDSARAWTLRERWWEALGGALDGRREQNDGYALASAATKSVSGLGSERAWRLRQAARPIAPVAALASLGGLDDAPSWSWREELLFSAPKVVMATLRAMRQPRAWAMRHAVAADCKEALDGITGMDDGEAWALREAHADRWPSTVVKSLGTLIDEPRGAAMLARQLAAHGANLSLLKHAATVALGLHRRQARPRGPAARDGGVEAEALGLAMSAGAPAPAGH